MSHLGENYFHTDDPVMLKYLVGVMEQALTYGQGVRLFTSGQVLEIARGGSSWIPFHGTPCSKRDTPARFSPSPFEVVGALIFEDYGYLPDNITVGEN